MHQSDALEPCTDTLACTMLRQRRERHRQTLPRPIAAPTLATMKVVRDAQRSRLCAECCSVAGADKVTDMAAVTSGDSIVASPQRPEAMCTSTVACRALNAPGPRATRAERRLQRRSQTLISFILVCRARNAGCPLHSATHALDSQHGARVLRLSVACS